MQRIIPVIVLAVLGASAQASTSAAAAVKGLEGRITLDMAQRLADKQLYDRARSVLEALAKSHRRLAPDAQRRIEGIDVLAKRATNPRLSAGGSAPALRRANALMDGGQWGEALALYQRMATGSTPAAVEARDCAAIIEALAQELLREGADLAAAQRLSHAALRLAMLEHRFAGTKAAKALEATLEKRLPDAAARGKLGPFLERLEPLIVTEPDTPGATKPTTATAAEPLDPVEADAKARRLVQLARNYVANGLSARAKPLLQRVLRDYPNTGAAAEAQALLAQIK